MEYWLPRVLGAWAVLNGVLVAGLAALAFYDSPLVYEPGGIGPDRIALARIFHPYEDSAGWFLILVSLLLVSVGIGLFTRRRWTLWAIKGVVLIAICATLFAIAWGVLRGEVGVAIGGAAKVILYLLIWVAVSTRSARRVFNR